MYRIGKSYEFSAAHLLTGHPGKCGHLHGHNYRVEIILEESFVEAHGPEEGMIVDFYNLDAVVKPVLEGLDHRFLADTKQAEEGWDDAVLVGTRTTAELLAKYLYYEIATSYKWTQKKELPLKEVIVYETPKAWASYSVTL